MQPMVENRLFVRWLLSILVIILALMAPSIYAQEKISKIQYRQLTMKDYIDKVEGGWLGQAIAVLWGQWTEGQWQGKMVPFDLEEWYRIKKDITDKANSLGDWQKRREFLQKYINDKNNWEIWQPDKMSDQDDLYIEFMFLHSIMKYGLDVTGTEIAEDWVRYLYPNRIWCANKGAYSLG